MVGAIISVFGAIITLVVSIYFLPRVGTIASAYAAVTTYAFMIVAGYLTGQKYYPIQYPIKKILTYVVVAVIMTVSLVLLRIKAWVILLILVTIAVADDMTFFLEQSNKLLAIGKPCSFDRSL